MFIITILLKMMIIAICIYGLYIWIHFTPKAWKEYKFSDKIFLVILYVFFCTSIIITIAWR